MNQPRYTVKQIGENTFVAHDGLQGLNAFNTMSRWRGEVEAWCYKHNRAYSNELARRPRTEYPLTQGEVR